MTFVSSGTARAHLPVAAIFLLSGVIMTAPLAWSLTTALVVPTSPGDAMFSIWTMWWRKLCWVGGHPANPVTLIGGVSGAPIWIWGLEPILEACLLGLTILTHELFAYNLFLWASFPMAGLTMYGLCWSLTRHRLASLAAGLAYAYAPYHVSHMAQLSLASIQWLPLVPLTLWHWAARPALRTFLLCCAAVVWTALWNPFYGILALLMLIWFSAAAAWGRGGARWQGGAGLLGVCLALIALAALATLKPSALAQLHARPPLKDLFVYSAKPWDYLIPSAMHPLWGSWVRPFVTAHLYGSNLVEQTLFIGYGVFALAVIALMHNIRGLMSERRVVWAFAGLGLIALLCSAPPFIPLGAFSIQHNDIAAPHKWYFPSFILSHVFPWFRVYARFGVLVMLAACVLAAFGLRAVLARLPSPRLRRAVGGLCCGLVLLESLPGLAVTDVSRVPPVYEWLARQPSDGLVVEYPWRRSDTAVHAEYLFWQRRHRKPLLNGGGARDAAYELQRQQSADLDDPRTPGRLAALGVRYLIVHPERYARPISATPPQIEIFRVTYQVPQPQRWEPARPPRRLDPALQRLGTFDTTVVYRIAPSERAAS